MDHPLRRKVTIEAKTFEEIAKNFSESMLLNNSNFQSPNENAEGDLEVYFENQLVNFSNNVIQIKEIFKQAMNVDINYEFKLSVGHTLINLKDLVDQLTQYFVVFEQEFKRKVNEKTKLAGIEFENKDMSNEMLVDEGSGKVFNGEEYNEKLEEIHEELDELNAVNIERLSEIRNVNNKLEMLNEHLNSLMKDIEQKRRKLLETESSITDENALIRSYENNLNEKNKLYKAKLMEYNQLKKKADNFNKQIGDMFFEIIDLDKRTEALKQPLKETEERKDNVKKELDERKANLEMMEKKRIETEQDIQLTQNRIESFKSKMEETQQEVRVLEQELNAKKILTNKTREELRQTIKLNIRKVIIPSVPLYS